MSIRNPAIVTDSRVSLYFGENYAMIDVTFSEKICHTG